MVDETADIIKIITRVKWYQDWQWQHCRLIMHYYYYYYGINEIKNLKLNGNYM